MDLEGMYGICEGKGFGSMYGRHGRLTTQTPGIAYLPSAAFRSMTLALF